MTKVKSVTSKPSCLESQTYTICWRDCDMQTTTWLYGVRPRAQLSRHGRCISKKCHRLDAQTV